MKPKIALITVLTNDVPRLVTFYRDVLGFSVLTELESYVEFESEGVRFSICDRTTMHQVTHHTSFTDAKSGQAFELAFPVDDPNAVDQTYEQVVSKGATPIHPPTNMPWNQRAAFFADPEGNIHELFAELPGG